MPTPRTGARKTTLRGVLATVAAICAAGGGLIHLNQIGSHLDIPAVAGGFALMGGAQWLFAVVVLLRPARLFLIAGGVLHAAIFAVWLVTRTVGLGFVTGAEVPIEIGVADLGANTFSLAVVGIEAIGTALDPVADPVVLPPPVATKIRAIALASAILFTVPALLVTHDHGSHPLDPPTHQSSYSLDHAPDPASHLGEDDALHSPSSADTTPAPVASERGQKDHQSGELHRPLRKAEPEPGDRCRRLQSPLGGRPQ